MKKTYTPAKLTIVHLQADIICTSITTDDGQTINLNDYTIIGTGSDGQAYEE